jgi:hypothetical protein
MVVVVVVVGYRLIAAKRILFIPPVDNCKIFGSSLPPRPDGKHSELHASCVLTLVNSASTPPL